MLMPTLESCIKYAKCEKYLYSFPRVSKLGGLK